MTGGVDVTGGVVVAGLLVEELGLLWEEVALFSSPLLGPSKPRSIARMIQPRTANNKNASVKAKELRFMLLPPLAAE
jgi:hypothetical protein